MHHLVLNAFSRHFAGRASEIYWTDLDSRVFGNCRILPTVTKPREVPTSQPPPALVSQQAFTLSFKRYFDRNECVALFLTSISEKCKCAVPIVGWT